jgi:hypothetical protein
VRRLALPLPAVPATLLGPPLAGLGRGEGGVVGGIFSPATGAVLAAAAGTPGDDGGGDSVGGGA